jgi:hypothetical protein
MKGFLIKIIKVISSCIEITGLRIKGWFPKI